MSVLPVTEADVQAYVDGALPAARAQEVEAYLAAHPNEAARAQAYREQAHALHREFNGILDEPVPERLRRAGRWGRVIRYGAVAGWLVAGGLIGWHLHAYVSDQRADGAGWPRRAAIAHIVYSPEVRHPVEVGADQEAHLTMWLSKRLGTPLKVPHLGGMGYTLVGGRLLPGERGPVAQFMYQDGKGLRLTLYVRLNQDDTRETAFRFSQESGISVFYWLDRKLGYALSGECEKAELLRVANAVYKQLNP